MYKSVHTIDKAISLPKELLHYQIVTQLRKCVCTVDCFRKAATTSALPAGMAAEMRKTAHPDQCLFAARRREHWASA
jgi:hypothetical protein